MTLYYCLLLLLKLFIFTHCNEETPSILVIGSGPSGIAAATKLWKHNFTNLKILEAEDRIGGRIKSIKFGDAYVDLGAEDCVGAEDNIVYDMVKQYNILKETSLRMKIIYSNGKYIDEDLSKNLVDFVDSVRLIYEGRRCSNTSSIGECFTKEFKSDLVKTYKDDPQKLKIILDSSDWLENYILSDESSFSLSDVSAKVSNNFSEGYFNWNGLGYKTILEVMLQQYPDSTRKLPLVDNILLNKEVTKIIWSNSTAKNSVRCSDNTVYEADHVIFTASLGVLKADHDQIFEPTLPGEKITAVKHIGFGAIMKIIFHFDTTWWNPQEAHTFLWSSEDKSNILTEFGKGPMKNGRSWLTTTIGFITAENNPKVLILFFAGEMIPELEKESDEVIRDGCMYMFRKFLGEKYTIVQPDKMIKSIWYNNPHFRGTYSYESVNGVGLREKLASPLNRENGNPSILFAGEATHTNYFGTVHGAIESGYREADRIIDQYRHK